MATSTMREQLYRQIEALPDDLVEQIAKFTQFVQEKRRVGSLHYFEWNDAQWQAFALGELFQDDDPVVYTLADAKEIYRP